MHEPPTRIGRCGTGRAGGFWFTCGLIRRGHTGVMDVDAGDPAALSFRP